MMSRMRSTRSLWSATPSRSSRIGSCRGRPLTAASSAASVEGAFFGSIVCPVVAVTPPPPGSGSRYSSRRSTSTSALRCWIAAIAQPNGLLSRTPPSTYCVAAGSAPASVTLRKQRARSLRSASGTHSWKALKLTGGKTPGKHDVARPANASGAVVASLELVALRAGAVRERQRVPVLRVVHEARLGDRDLPVVAVEVGDRDVEIQPVVLGDERLGLLGAPRLRAVVHLLERVEEPLRHLVAAQRRRLAARAAAAARTGA